MWCPAVIRLKQVKFFLVKYIAAIKVLLESVREDKLIYSAARRDRAKSI